MEPFLYLLVLTCFLFVVLNVHQPELWARTMAVVELSPAAGPTGSPGPGSAAAAPGPGPGPGPGPEPPAPPGPDSPPLPRWPHTDVDPEKILNLNQPDTVLNETNKFTNLQSGNHINQYKIINLIIYYRIIWVVDKGVSNIKNDEFPARNFFFSPNLFALNRQGEKYNSFQRKSIEENVRLQILQKIPIFLSKSENKTKKIVTYYPFSKVSIFIEINDKA
ncbi:Glycoprotein 3-alpha-L-fucosyltransferase A [Gryllus bimaculatus]|nr:Glycoprotein 3-alpha-L-fucosyltransferase A [Gryllus bimaculatus]